MCQVGGGGGKFLFPPQSGFMGGGQGFLRFSKKYFLRGEQKSFFEKPLKKKKKKPLFLGWGKGENIRGGLFSFLYFMIVDTWLYIRIYFIFIYVFFIFSKCSSLFISFYPSHIFMNFSLSWSIIYFIEFRYIYGFLTLKFPIKYYIGWEARRTDEPAPHNAIFFFFPRKIRFMKFYLLVLL